MDNQTTVANRLINEKSPYLLQHAHNPVDWFPWGEEAFEKAAAEDKPIFLSIGYSTCHWCHVMERESFEDEEVAAILNQHFISIKVDREERPDIDNIYMNYCQATTGHGGWPLTVFLTPNKEPFYSGTYFPKESRYGLPGIMDLLERIQKRWTENRKEIEASAKSTVSMLISLSQGEEAEDIDHKVFYKAFEYFEKSFDSIYGGFGDAPKFPTPHNLLFLLRYYKTMNEIGALEMVEKTLLQMYKGGIFDHIGYGFSRYSTDRKWLVPHFEKMMYDNALLIMAYTEAFQVTKKQIYKEVSEKIISYVLRDMTSDEGGFYCAEDADSEGIEGKFYVWTEEEIIDLLGEEDGSLYCKYYDITKKGNFEEKNIPNLIKANGELLEKDTRLNEKLLSLSEKLFEIRERRVRPHKDDKILTSWNGLMIAALSMAGKAFENATYLECAKKGIQFIEKNMIREDGRLFARYRHGEVKHLAYLDDYAFLIWAYIELYQGVFEVKYLRRAKELTENMLSIFDDKESAGFFLYGNDSEQLISRPKEIYDGALPSGNSVAAYILLRISKMTGKREYEERAEKLFDYFSGKINQSPMAYTMLLCAILYARTPTKEVVIAGKKEDKILKEMVQSIHSKYMPFSETLIHSEVGQFDHLNEFIKNQQMIDGKTTVYVCENFACKEPVFDIEELNKLI